MYEKNFEEYIERKLIENGYKQIPSAKFNVFNSLFEEELMGFIQETQSEQVEKLKERVGDDYWKLFLTRLDKEISHKGLLEVIRGGIRVNLIDFKLAYFVPNSGLNPDLDKLVKHNKFGVTRQLFYSNRHQNSLDMVLSLNGFPIITLELKNPMTGQNYINAMNQYKKDRNPRETIFAMDHRSLVHFAVDPEMVYMTTKLNGDKTFFLPFNRGTEDGGAGNDRRINEQYSIEYLWRDVFNKENLLELVQKFIHKDKKKNVLIFPRYHQWEAVREIVKDAKCKGSGENYLIQHSAGSGKSNSISWLAHQLSSLHDNENNPVFDSVIIITDRKALDRQLQGTIKQFEKAAGVVEWAKNSSGELAEFLERGTKIIVTTLQKFPFALKKLKELKGKNFAVIIDEAHNSQNGEAASKLRATLADVEDTDDMVLRELKAQGKQKNISFFAFTATPKKETLEVFGTKKTNDEEPKPFHNYSMKQAIQEGFIMDVLKNYTTYRSYFRLVKRTSEDPKFQSSKASRAIGRYVSQHPRNIEEKTNVIIEHFLSHTKHKMNGRAKAMLVTTSREQAIRYKLAFDEVLKDKGFPLKTVVAFSDKIEIDGIEFDEAKLNGFPESQTTTEFEKDEYRILIVANKYQTGFDQPLLHTMYVDKKLDGINCVQTLSRLNRMHPDKKDTLVLDFVNEPEDIQKSFQKFYQTTLIDKTTDLDGIYDLVDFMNEKYVYNREDVFEFGRIAFNTDNFREHPTLHRIVDRAYKEFDRLEDEEKDEFHIALKKFIDKYGYLTQLIPLEDEYLLYLNIFGKRLNSVIKTVEIEDINIDNMVELDRYNLKKVGETNISLEDEDGVISGPGTDIGQRILFEEKALSEIIELMNGLFGQDITQDQAARFLDDVYNDAIKDEELGLKAQVNDKNTFNKDFVEENVLDLLEKGKERNMNMYEASMNNDQVYAMIGKLLANKVFEHFNVENRP